MKGRLSFWKALGFTLQEVPSPSVFEAHSAVFDASALSGSTMGASRLSSHNFIAGVLGLRPMPESASAREGLNPKS